MKKITSAKKTFHQGWNNPQASYDECPGMVNKFTYDYWLDSIEVTQKLYYDLMGRQPVAAVSQYGVGDDYPVYYVSWFDAALFCNTRSRVEGLDTVYNYSGVKALANGTTYELTGLRDDLTKNGYRLPTESEWEYAAREGSSSLPYIIASDSMYASYYAWYWKNSSGKTHRVATRQPNSFGLYDMAGNVFEWTNDWKCMYTGNSITNSCGSMLPLEGFEKVLKGGGFNLSLTYLRPSHRSAIYTTTLYSACEYVGFRCARASIPNGQYIGFEQGDFIPNPLTVNASTYDLYSLFGTSRSKCVFINVSGSNRTLCYIDFSQAFSYVKEFLDDRNAFLPTISPDGRYVAYCSKNEGMHGPSKISIRSLDSLNSPIVQLSRDSAYLPRWWINQNSGDTFIVYTNSAVDNEISLWPSTKTFLQKVSNGTPAGSEQLFINDGSYHDGVSISGQYAITGFRRLIIKDLFSNTPGEQLFLSPQNGKDSAGSPQVCNVSISPDSGDSARCMFLDFGYPRMSTVTGSTYSPHEYLFQSTMSGRITDYLHCPSGEQEWDGVEWSNQKRYAVGCGRNSAEQAHAVYVIDFDDKSFKQIVTGTELQQPYLWVGRGGTYNYAFDSLGMYNDPPLYGLITPISWGLHLFWQKHNNLEVVITGSSQALEGIDCNMFRLPSLNMSYCGCGIGGEIMLIKNYVLLHCPKIKVICMDIAVRWLADSAGNMPVFYGPGIVRLETTKGFLYDQSHQFWTMGIPPHFEENVNNAPFINCCQMDTFGTLLYGCQNWGQNIPECVGRVEWNTSNLTYKTNLSLFKSLTEELAARSIHVIAIVFPENPGYINSTDCFAYGGPSKSTGYAIMNHFKALEYGNPYYHFYNAYNFGNHDYVSSDFCNSNHLCIDGARKLACRLDTLIDSLLF